MTYSPNTMLPTVSATCGKHARLWRAMACRCVPDTTMLKGTRRGSRHTRLACAGQESSFHAQRARQAGWHWCAQPRRRRAGVAHPEQAARKADQQQEQARPHRQVDLHLLHQAEPTKAAKASALAMGAVTVKQRQYGYVYF